MYNPSFLGYKVNTSFVVETLSYSQTCGTKVGMSYKKRCAGFLEKQHGSKESYDNMLERAVKACPPEEKTLADGSKKKATGNRKGL